MYVCVYTALTTTPVLCARSPDLVMLVIVRRVHAVSSTAEFKGGGKQCRKTRETAALRRVALAKSLRIRRVLHVHKKTFFH